MTANITQDVHAEPARNANDMEISTRTLGFPGNAAAVLAPIVTSAVVGDDASENGVDRHT